MIADPAERELAIALLEFEGLVREVEQTLDFHRLCGYLHGLATTFTSFYERCPILRAEATTRVSRLALCGLTARMLALGLDLLGIIAPDRM